jgi:predicted nucleic acid-binding protein
MSKKFLVDTDVLIDYLRGNDKAVNYINTYSEKILLSAISVAELYAGVKDDERRVLAEFIGLFPVLPVTMIIATLGGGFTRGYYFAALITKGMLSFSQRNTTLFPSI